MNDTLGTELTEDKGSKMYLAVVCLIAALGGLLFGYDTAVISGAIGFLQIKFNLAPGMVGWAASCALVGCMIGAGFAGILSDRIGRKKTLIISALLFLISAVGTALPKTLTQFIIFRVIGGLGVGAASMTSPMYIAEISPARIRGRMVSVNQFAIIFGMLVVYFVNYFIAGSGDEVWDTQTGWRWMFGSESLPSLLFLLLLLPAPESPRWLIEKGRGDTAFKILSRVGGSSHAKKEKAEIEEILSLEENKSVSIAQLFHPKMRIILIIGIALAIFQQVTGITVICYYAPEIFKQMGSGTNAALLQTVLIGVVNLTFTIVAIWVVDKLGRKPLMIIGNIGMGISIMVVGMAAYYQTVGVWVLVFILLYIASFAISVGPVTWVILSEIFPTKIRGRAMSIATVCLWVAAWTITQTFPMIDKNPWLVEKFNHAFAFWFYGVMCVLAIIFITKYIPETKGKSLEEIEKMWLEK